MVGTTVQVWRSNDLVDWEYRGTPFTLKDSWHEKPGDRVWAPEVHWIEEVSRWALVHCPGRKANFALSNGSTLKGPWAHPMGERLGGKHDPSLFKDPSNITDINARSYLEHANMISTRHPTLEPEQVAQLALQQSGLLSSSQAAPVTGAEVPKRRLGKIGPDRSYMGMPSGGYSRPATPGGAPKKLPAGTIGRDREAWEWAQANPDDPRAQQLLEELGPIFGG